MRAPLGTDKLTVAERQSQDKKKDPNCCTNAADFHRRSFNTPFGFTSAAI